MSIQGVPGTLNGIGYLEASPDMQNLRERSSVVHMQIVSNAILLTLFIHNTQCAIKMVNLHSNKVAPWCCLLPSAIGVIFFSGCSPCSTIYQMVTLASRLSGVPSPI
jgi:hypothetical protein